MNTNILICLWAFIMCFLVAFVTSTKVFLFPIAKIGNLFESFATWRAERLLRKAFMTCPVCQHRLDRAYALDRRSLCDNSFCKCFGHWQSSVIETKENNVGIYMDMRIPPN